MNETSRKSWVCAICLLSSLAFGQRADTRAVVIANPCAFGSSSQSNRVGSANVETLQATCSGTASEEYYHSQVYWHRGVGEVDVFYWMQQLGFENQCGWIEWNIAQIPDTAVIQDVRLLAFRDTTGADTVADTVAINDMNLQPSVTDSADTLYNDCSTGARYASLPYPSDTGWVVFDLNDSAARALKSHLALDWFAVGLECSENYFDQVAPFCGTEVPGHAPRLVVEYALSALADKPDPAGCSRLTVHVCPSPGTDYFRFTWQGSARELAVFDMSGRPVYRLTRCTGNQATWNRRDGAGQRVPAGVYVARVSSDHDQASCRFVVR
jgi:hypothetical protein